MTPRLLTLVGLLGGSLLATPAFSATLREQAQAAWAQRADPAQTRKAIELWQQAYKAEPTRHELLIEITRAANRATRRTAAKKEKRRWAQLALDTGKDAVSKNPSSQALTAYAEALGQWAETHKGIRGLKVVRQAVDSLNKAVSLDPQNAYAHMLLAQFYRKAPASISVGDKDKALKHARLAVQAGPQYAINHLVLAESYLDHGRKEDAVRELQTILALTPPADAVPETLADQNTAREKLSALGVAGTGPNVSTPPAPGCVEGSSGPAEGTQCAQ